MTVAWKYVLLALLTAGALAYLTDAARATAQNLYRLSAWKRFPATVKGAVDPVTIEVDVGNEGEQTILKIPRTYDAGYDATSQVTVMENPKKPGERRLTGFFDLWNRTIVSAIFGLALLTAAWLVWNTSWGVDAVWNDGAWKAAPTAVEATPDLEVFEPRESWKANLFYGCVLGLLMAIPAYFVRGEWKPWPAIVATVGTGFFLWMVQSATLNYTRTVRLSQVGLEERSWFGSRRIEWNNLGGLEFHDVKKFNEDLSNLGRSGTRKFSTLPRIDVWAVLDREGRWVISLPAEMTPADTFRAMRERLQHRTAPDGKSAPK